MAGIDGFSRALSQKFRSFRSIDPIRAFITPSGLLSSHSKVELGEVNIAARAPGRVGEVLE